MSSAEFSEVLDKLPSHLQEQVYAFAKWLLEAEEPNKPAERMLGLHEGMMEVAEDFDDPLPDAFWLGET